MHVLYYMQILNKQTKLIERIKAFKCFMGYKKLKRNKHRIYKANHFSIYKLAEFSRKYSYANYKFNQM